MERKTFLRQLSHRLYWCCSRKDAKEILSDYQECFDAGNAEGRPEAAVCIELGTPREIVKALQKEKDFLHRVSLGKVLGWTLALVPLITVLVFIKWRFFHNELTFYPGIQPFCILYPPVLLFVLLGGLKTSTDKPKAWRMRRSPRLKTALVLCYLHGGGALTSAWLLFFTGFSNQMKGPWLWALPTNVPALYGPYLSGLLCTGLAAVVAAIVIELALGVESLVIFPLMFLNAGMLAATECIMFLQTEMDSVEGLSVSVLKIGALLLFAMVLASASAMGLYIVSRRASDSLKSAEYFVKKEENQWRDS